MAGGDDPSLATQTSIPAACQNGLDIAIRRELALITVSAGVMSETVRHEIGPDGWLRIHFDLETEVPVEPLETALLPREPITLIYDSADAVGIIPPLVQSGRDDFPRTLGHLNPIIPGRRVSFCLARAGLQSIYDRFGIEGVMQRLRSWLRDAMTGALMADGWDPVPLPRMMPALSGFIDAAWFQELAAGKQDGTAVAAGIAQVSCSRKTIQIFSGEVDPDRPAHNSALARALAAKSGEERSRFPWAFVWTTGSQSVSEPVFGLWKTYGEMRAALTRLGLTDALDRVTGAILANGCDCKHTPGQKSAVILVGVRRPVQLSPDIFGLSADPAARQYEIKAFLLETEITGELLSDSTPIRLVISHPAPSPALYRYATGVPEIGKLGLFGYGALGSAIADHAIRSGASEIVAIDDDILMPHNLARHTASSAQVYKSKVDVLMDTAAALGALNSSTKVIPIRADVLSLSAQDLAGRLGSSSLLIDATADERVRGRLSQYGPSFAGQIVRIELYRRGRLGSQFVSGVAGNPSLFDLYYLLCRESLDDETVAAWLLEEHLGEVTPDELQIGFGCASATTRLPNYVIAQHAAAFMPTILAGAIGETGSGIGLNQLDADFRPAGWRWIAAPNYLDVSSARSPDWTIRIHPDVVAMLTRFRQRALPAETGGYLYGGWDAALKQITIVYAGDLPPGSTCTEGEVVLGPAGYTAIEKRIRRKSFGRLRLCGSWHSHPGCSTAMSPKDEETMKSFRRIDQPNGIPTLLVIVGAEGVEAHLET